MNTEASNNNICSSYAITVSGFRLTAGTDAIPARCKNFFTLVQREFFCMRAMEIDDSAVGSHFAFAAT